MELRPLLLQWRALLPALLVMFISGCGGMKVSPPFMGVALDGYRVLPMQDISNTVTA